MEILEVNAKEYTQVINKPFHQYGTANFNNLNKDKCNEVYYLLFKDRKFRLGIIGGIRNNAFYSPFSAPFGGFTYISRDIRIQYIEDAIKTLRSWAVEKQLSSISITLPPAIYERSFIAKQANCLYREGFVISENNLNYSFDLEFLDDKYSEHIWYNARKNLKVSLNSGLEFYKCRTDEEKETAFDIIRKNRESRGFPLAMTMQQVLDTTQLIPADFFLVYNNLQTPIASAIVFHVTQEIVQVIYWGGIPGFAEIKPMNYIAFKVFEYYKSIEKMIVDIGPSTEGSTPNYGLCEFKESIGCDVFTKISLMLDLK